MKTLFHFFKNKPEWMSEFYSQLQIIWEEKKVFIIVISSFLTLLLFLILSGYKNTKETDLIALQNKRSEAILHELNDINSVLHDVEINPLNSKQQQIALQALEKDITSVQKTMVDVAKSTDIQKVSSQISMVKDDIDTQIGDLKKAVSKSIDSKEYLDASALPFHVISVDVIAGQPYVSVEYANHFSPLSVGDLLVGWRVVRTDYDAGVSEFVNDKNQYVKVSMQGA